MKDQARQLIEATFTLTRLMRDKKSFNKCIANLTMIQLHTLVFIKKNAGVQMSDIAKEFKIELPSATSLINKLVTMNLVQRKTDEKDRRLVRIVVTEQGMTLLQQTMKEKIKHISELLSYLTQDEQQFLLTTIKKINTKLEENL
jgi:DNA-binding MarR family transcriptional regulator